MRPWLLIPFLLCACAERPPGPADGALVLDRAELLLDGAEEPPAVGAWQSVSLPDRWRERRPDAGGVGWYRFEVPGPATSNQTWAVYLPHLNMNAAVWVNGAPVGSGGSFAEPVAHNFNRPLYFSFPSALLDRPVNSVHVRLFAYAHHYGELGPVWIGPDTVLRPLFESVLWRRTTLSQIATALCAVIVLFSAGLWLGSQRDPVYGWLAVVTALWGLASLNYWLRDLPVPHPVWERIVHPTLDSFMLALIAHE